MGRKKSIPTQCSVKTREKNGKKYISYCFEGVPVDGKRNQIEVGGFSSYEEAKKAGDEALIKYYRGGNVKNDNVIENLITVQDFINNVWFEKRAVQKNWLPSTKASYRKQIDNYIIPAIGKMPISSVASSDLQKIVDNLYYKQKYTFMMVSNLHGLIHGIFKYANEHGYVAHYYSDEFVVPKKDVDLSNPNSDLMDLRNEQKRDVIPSDNLKKIFDRFPEGSASFLIMTICLFTGAKLGEASALAVEDCDFEANLIKIRRQFPDGAKDFVTNPKYDSARVVPMCPTLKSILLRAIETNKKNEDIWGNNYQHTFLTKRTDSEEYKNLHGVYDINYEGGYEIHFFNLRENGQVITPEVMKHASRIIHGYSSDPKKKKAKGKAIYADYNTHSLRHTFASHLDKEGVSDTVKSAVLGHKRSIGKDASKTTNNYIHATDEQIQEICEIVDKIFSF